MEVRTTRTFELLEVPKVRAVAERTSVSVAHRFGARSREHRANSGGVQQAIRIVNRRYDLPPTGTGCACALRGYPVLVRRLFLVARSNASQDQNLAAGRKFHSSASIVRRSFEFGSVPNRTVESERVYLCASVVCLRQANNQTQPEQDDS